jgi:hypothetical protein
MVVETAVGDEAAGWSGDAREEMSRDRSRGSRRRGRRDGRATWQRVGGVA